MEDRGQLDCVVVGGGISGLTVATCLADSGQKVRLIESGDRVGGALCSVRRDGFLAEEGPNSILVKDATVWHWLENLQLGSELCMASPEARFRFLVRNGRVHALPYSPLSAIRTPLYRFSEKLRVLAEPFIRPTTAKDESVTRFVSRRLGPAFLEYGIAALVSGIYAGNPDELSMRHAFPKVWNLEQKYKSLIRGAFGIRRDRKRQGIRPFQSRMISFRDGLESLPRHLAARARFSIETQTSMEELHWDDLEQSWRIRTRGAQEKACLARNCILAVPANRLRNLPLRRTGSAELTSLPVPSFPPVSTLTLGFPRTSVGHPLNGFGVLCPRKEKRFCLGVIFSSTLFPERAPADHVTLMAFIGGALQRENASLGTEELVRHAMQDLRPLLGISGDPVFVHHRYWPEAIPQYNLGFEAWLTALESVESTFPNLYFTGNYRNGPGLNDCIQSAIELAARLTP